MRAHTPVPSEKRPPGAGTPPVVALALLAALLSASVASSAVIIVEGDCTLVDAMTAANTDAPAGSCPAGSGTDRIVLTEDVALSRVVSTGEDGDSGTPVVTSEIRIEGNGHVVERLPGSPAFMIFQVAAGGGLSLDSVEVRGGLESDAGGILNIGVLALSNTTVADNKGGPAGIENRGTATIRDSTVTGGDGGNSGGIGNYFGHLTLVNSSVSGNEGSNTGGVINEHGAVYISGSRIEDNFGYYQTGGLDNDGILFLVDSTVSGNSSGAGGTTGGIRNAGYDTYLYMSGSTVSGNDGNNNGGISSSLGDLVVVNSTVSGNFSYLGLPAVQMDGGYLWNVTIADNSAGVALDLDHAPVELRNVVLGQPTGINCRFTENAIDLGGNLSDDDSCPPFFGELTGLDPVLADNGGPTETHALLPGSSAVDAGGACGLAPDQRGFLRDAGCDSGAFELGATESVGGIVTGLDGRRVNCMNETSGQSVQIVLGGATAWDCTAAGLVVVPGDRVAQRVSGEADGSSTAGGSVAGHSVEDVTCRNLSTGEMVAFTPPGPAWSCADELSGVDPGDFIVQRISGAAPG